MNLSPLRYSRVMKEKGGPIERIHLSKIKLAGCEMFQANAYLTQELCRDPVEHFVFGASDGTGTDSSALVARYKSISEALERWAYFSIMQSGDTVRFGFDVDGSTSGMAAYPGLFRTGSRKRAQAEAVERYCLRRWWHGHLGTISAPSSASGIHAVKIENPLTHHQVLLVWSRSGDGLWSYGVAADQCSSNAYGKALIEMNGMKGAVEQFQANHPGWGEPELASIQNKQERGFLYYALPVGHGDFMKRIGDSATKHEAVKVSPIVDCEIPGPWSPYATVWRILYPVPETPEAPYAFYT